ncbi:MAG: aldolase [Eubacterium sp.]|nr:aldolase [Eubacterium sp.]
MLKLMYITNQPNIAKIVQNAGVDRIFIDMEYIGKTDRQGGMDTVQNHHTVDDVKAVRAVLDKSDLLVRVNPIHEDSKAEIDEVVSAGADLIMLPMWKTADEVKRFLECVDGRVKTVLLLENKEAIDCLDDVLAIDGIDEIHIGLNDLHLSLGLDFIFEPLANSVVESITEKIKNAGVPFGFGGFGRIGEGLLPAEYIVSEHYRLGSSMAILSRTFCDLKKITDENEVFNTFDSGVKKLREYEEFLSHCEKDFFDDTHQKLCDCVKMIIEENRNV